ncbi:hypothetical protein SALBM135S_00329 [Streptomyces alboniger]
MTPKGPMSDRSSYRSASSGGFRAAEAVGGVREPVEVEAPGEGGGGRDGRGRGEERARAEGGQGAAHDRRADADHQAGEGRALHAAARGRAVPAG